ncbi:MAG: glycosyltransferase family 2 protein, partial [Leptospira sp.]|nr:glycosyltransferase family 2 protein [Leptospira sp.]
LDFADEIVVVDSGSTDKTIALLKKAKIKIRNRKFDNYVNQKNYCLSLARNNWVLALDADEVVSKGLREEIISLSRENFRNFDAFYIPRLTFYLGKWIRHGGWYPNYQIRLFRKDKGKFGGMLVHEKVSIGNNFSHTKNPLHHYSYKNISDHLKFIDRYSDLTALERFKAGKNSGVARAISEAAWKFFSMYLLRLGFLDGKEGLVVAILGSYYNFLKYIKLFELRRKKEQ